MKGIFLMLIDSFHNYLKVERNYSPHTVDAYLSDLHAFAIYMEEEFETRIFIKADLETVTHRMIRTWMGHLLENGLGKRSVARKIASVNAWYKFLLKTGKIGANPAARIKVPKFEKKLPSFLKEDSITDLLDGIEFPDTFEGKRDKCLLEILYSCGLRRSEIIGLEIQNIDFNAKTLKVLGKGRKERIVPFGSMAFEAMNVYIKECEAAGMNQTKSFFITAKGKPFYPRLVNNIVEKYLEQVCSLKKKSPHVLRHTFATHLLDNGADLNAIKELLGHTSLAATQVYTHNSISKLKDVYKNAHPKA